MAWQSSLQSTKDDSINDYRRCPKGHTLPRETHWGRCNPLHCADDIKQLDAIPPALDESKVDDQLSKTAKDAIVQTAKKQIQKASRERLVEVPEFKSAAEAEDWVNAEKAKMLPYALAEKEFQLLYGNDDQRNAASDYFLDSMGHGKREAGLGSAATIIIMGDASMLRPWLPKGQGIPTTIDAREAGRLPLDVMEAPTTVEALPATTRPTEGGPVQDVPTTPTTEGSGV